MSSDAPLSRRFDAALLDLDGTVYLGGVVIPDVPAAVARAREDGMTCLFVTNNASRPPAVVAATLDAMGVPATADAVLTSPEAAADMVAAAHPQGSKVLVVGTDHITDCVRAVGLQPVHSADEQPVAIVQGLSQQLGWPELAEACIALRAGADWVATNVDATLPTDRGLLPGNGSLVAALERATGLHPRVAGKPQRPLIDSAIARAGSRRPLVVGDRLDTDIEAAVSAGVPALMPLTGVNTAVDLLVAPPARRPVFVSFDLRGLVVADRVVDLTDPAAGRGWTVESTGPDAEALVLHRADDGVDHHPHEDAAALAALTALLRQAWRDPSAAVPRVTAADPDAAAALARLGIPDAAGLH